MKDRAIGQCCEPERLRKQKINRAHQISAAVFEDESGSFGPFPIEAGSNTADFRIF